MTPKKKASPPRVRVRALLSFDGMYAGDEAETELTERVQGWLNLGFAKVVADGTGKAGPGVAEPDDHERVQVGAAGSGPAGGEPSEGFGAGGYGAAEGFDQG